VESTPDGVGPPLSGSEVGLPIGSYDIRAVLTSHDIRYEEHWQCNPLVPMSRTCVSLLSSELIAVFRVFIRLFSVQTIAVFRVTPRQPAKNSMPISMCADSLWVLIARHFSTPLVDVNLRNTPPP
jgi:hypothetical protein